MCGIAGKVFLNGGEVREKDILLMTRKIAHRGPDDEGIYISKDRKIGLGNRRLAIIDLSTKGHMPMNYMGRYWITYNGEIYNFRQERKKLIKLGYKFVSNTDTEVILALYDKYKEKCLGHLRGMFAFAIYDTKAKKIFFARDRLGKKPLKYYFDGRLFCFASELKAILTQPEITATPDYLAINNYLTYGYLHAPLTGFGNIYKLEPGHYLLLDLKTGELNKASYWRPDFSEKLDLSETEWKERILSTLEESVRLRMIADVPVGAFLSGGVDSSAVVAMMSRMSKNPVKTFTIGFKEKSHDETAHAQRIVNLFKTDHTTLEVTPESAEILPEVVRQYEEPYADNSAIITYLVSKLASKHVTVALNGDGGDELFAGYDRYFRVKRDVMLGPWRALALLGQLVSQSLGYPRGERFFKKLKLPISDRYLSYIHFFSEADKAKLYSDSFKALVKFSDSSSVIKERLAEAGDVDFPDRVLYADITGFLPEDLLTKVDLASMAFGLEGRSPFIDHKMVELTCQIPFSLKVKGFSIAKYILKKSLEGLVPEQNLYRKKFGFTIPLGKWLAGDLKKYAKAFLLAPDARTKNLFDENYVKTLINTHSESQDFGTKLWALLTLELWFREYFD